jgi:hypothetical protein
MKKLLAFLAIVGSIFLLVSGSPVGTADTGPYLAGTYLRQESTFPITNTVHGYAYILNPTASRITACCCAYEDDGDMISCSVDTLAANGGKGFQFHSENAALLKCIALPEGKWTFDPNVVIGGMIQENVTIGAENPFLPGALFHKTTKVNMHTVVINSKTLPEFNRVMQDCRSTAP